MASFSPIIISLNSNFAKLECFYVHRTMVNIFICLFITLSICLSISLSLSLSLALMLSLSICLFCFLFNNKLLSCSATMDIHCVLPVKRGYKIDAPLVDKSLEILGVWPWRRWLSHLNCPASITPWDAQKYFHTTVSLNMRQCATSDHITVRMLDQSVLLSGISHSWLPI